MVQTPITPTSPYPDSDGKPMAENTEQYQWITRLVTNLKHLLRDQTAFIAGDLLWYPVQVEPGQKVPAQAPDAMVVLGRPAGDRGSYKQWEEEGIAPQVVFEIISPSNTAAEMVAKQIFYMEHGVLEMYFYNPDSYEFWGLIREAPEETPTPVMPLNLPWVSPLLKIRFAMFEDGLEVSYPDGKPFKAPEEFALAVEEMQAQYAQVQVERDRALEQEQQAQAERDRAQEELAQALAKLKALGVEPDAVD